jgi:hypothetical protein
MIGVAENDARIEFVLKHFETHALNCSGGADGHENWRLDNAATRGQHAGARCTIAG